MNLKALIKTLPTNSIQYKLAQQFFEQGKFVYHSPYVFTDVNLSDDLKKLAIILSTTEAEKSESLSKLKESLTHYHQLEVYKDLKTSRNLFAMAATFLCVVTAGVGLFGGLGAMSLLMILVVPLMGCFVYYGAKLEEAKQQYDKRTDKIGELLNQLDGSDKKRTPEVKPPKKVMDIEMSDLTHRSFGMC